MTSKSQQQETKYISHTDVKSMRIAEKKRRDVLIVIISQLLPKLKENYRAINKYEIST